MKAKRELLDIWDALATQERETLLSFAQFLRVRSEALSPPSRGERGVPQMITARADETVVGALKRLAASYPMLDKGKLLDETSIIMAQYTLQGRAKADVIADLEQVFQRAYEKFAAD